MMESYLFLAVIRMQLPRPGLPLLDRRLAYPRIRNRTHIKMIYIYVKSGQHVMDAIMDPSRGDRGLVEEAVY